MVEAMRALFVLLSLSCLAAAQSRLAFEVVSIKPAPRPTPETIRSGTFRVAFNVDGVLLRISGYTPVQLLTAAFRVQPFQVDAPDFARSEYFEIQATLPEKWWERSRATALTFSHYSGGCPRTCRASVSFACSKYCPIPLAPFSSRCRES